MELGDVHDGVVVPDQFTTSKNDVDAVTNCLEGTSVSSEPKPNCDEIKKGKREQYLTWDEYFMGVATLAAQRSKDPVTQVGAVVVNSENRIVGSGYNGMPNGCADDIMPWGKTSTVGAVVVNSENRIVGSGYNGMPNGCADDIMPWGKTSTVRSKTKYPYVCHAEMNAIVNSHVHSLKGLTMYTVLFPCNECAKLIIQSGISDVVYKHDKPEKVSMIASKKMFDRVGIRYRQFSSQRKLLLNLCADKGDRIIESGSDNGITQTNEMGPIPKDSDVPRDRNGDSGDEYERDGWQIGYEVEMNGMGIVVDGDETSSAESDQPSDSETNNRYAGYQLIQTGPETTETEVSDVQNVSPSVQRDFEQVKALNESSNVHMKDSDFVIQHNPRQIVLDEDKVACIKNAMSSFTLPAPSWANGAKSDDQLKQIIDKISRN